MERWGSVLLLLKSSCTKMGCSFPLQTQYSISTQCNRALLRTNESLRHWALVENRTTSADVLAELKERAYFWPSRGPLYCSYHVPHLQQKELAVFKCRQLPQRFRFTIFYVCKRGLLIMASKCCCIKGIGIYQNIPAGPQRSVGW